MSQQGGRKRYATEIIKDESETKRRRTGEPDIGDSQNPENEGGDASLPSSQAGPKTRSKTASQESAMHLTEQTPAAESTGADRVVHVPTPTRITRSTATACDPCYNGHRKVLATREPADQISARRLTAAEQVNSLPAKTAPQRADSVPLHDEPRKKRSQGLDVEAPKILKGASRACLLFRPWAFDLSVGGKRETVRRWTVLQGGELRSGKRVFPHGVKSMFFWFNFVSLALY